MEAGRHQGSGWIDSKTAVPVICRDSSCDSHLFPRLLRTVAIPRTAVFLFSFITPGKPEKSHPLLYRHGAFPPKNDVFGENVKFLRA
jgi:hypothetical protein